MVLFHDIVEILALPDGDGRLVSLVVPLDRGRVRATLIDGDLLREPLGTNGLTEECLGGGPIALRGEQKINGVALFVAA